MLKMKIHKDFAKKMIEADKWLGDKTAGYYRKNAPSLYEFMVKGKKKLNTKNIV